MSDKPNHTPGPWYVKAPKVITAPDQRGDRLIYNGIQQHIAEVFQYRDPLHRDKDTAIANAHLIAASPDLLAACEELVAEFERAADEELERAMGSGVLPSEYNDTAGIAMARAAIAKAKGER